MRSGTVIPPKFDVFKLYTSPNPRIYAGKSERMLSPLTRSPRRGRKTGRVIVKAGGLRTADYAVRPLRRPQSRSQSR